MIPRRAPPRARKGLFLCALLAAAAAARAAEPAAATLLAGETIGRVLVREKMISDAECEESLRRMKASKRMQGTVLIDMGCISPHNLQYALTMQLQQKLFDAFRWEEGEYQFNPSVTPPPGTGPWTPAKRRRCC